MHENRRVKAGKSAQCIAIHTLGAYLTKEYRSTRWDFTRNVYPEIHTSQRFDSNRHSNLLHDILEQNFRFTRKAQIKEHMNRVFKKMFEGCTQK